MKSNKHAKMLLQSAGFWDAVYWHHRGDPVSQLQRRRLFPSVTIRNDIIVSLDSDGWGWAQCKKTKIYL